MIRFLIDDAGQSRTQRAVLRAFAASLPPSARVEWSSELPAPAWSDVPAAPARLLAARLAALAPMAGVRTVYVPGHMIPGKLDPAWPAPSSGAFPRPTTVMQADAFVVDNGLSHTSALSAPGGAGAAYETASATDLSALAAPPEWGDDGPEPALLLNHRPWYSAEVRTRSRWLDWVRRASEGGLLTPEDIERDVAEGLVRPSLISEAEGLRENGGIPPMPDLTLDALYLPPEVSLTAAQRALLHSGELQERTLASERKRLAGKARKPKAPSPGRKQPGLAYRIARAIYRVTLRPAVQRLRARSARRS